MFKKSGSKVSFVVLDTNLLERAIAFIIDMLVIRFTIMLPFQNFLKELALAIKAAGNTSFEGSYNYLIQHPEITEGLYIMMLVISVLAILYFSILESKFGQTIGKMLLGIRVICEIKPEKRVGRGKNEILSPSILQCIIRNIFLIPFFPFVLLWIIEPLFMILRKDHKRLLELITATRSVRYQEY